MLPAVLSAQQKLRFDHLTEADGFGHAIMTTVTAIYDLPSTPSRPLVDLESPQLLTRVTPCASHTSQLREQMAAQHTAQLAEVEQQMQVHTHREQSAIDPLNNPCITQPPPFPKLLILRLGLGSGLTLVPSRFCSQSFLVSF